MRNCLSEENHMSNRSLAFRATPIITAALLCIGAVGCGSSDGDPTGDVGTEDMTSGCVKKPPTDPAGHACWHVCEETPIEVAAATTSDDASTAPEVSFGSTYRISLTDNGDDTYSGVIRFDAGANAIADSSSKNIHFFTVRDVPFAIRPVSDSSADPTGPNSTGSITCDQGLSRESVFEMQSDAYAVDIGPTDDQEVTLVIVPFGGPDNA
jgi:hypothetical protein